MAPHKFVLGQRVVVRSGSLENHIPQGIYTISRALPGDDLDRSYRVRHAGDGHERVVREQQIEAHDGLSSLRSAAAPIPAPRPARTRIVVQRRGEGL